MRSRWRQPMVKRSPWLRRATEPGSSSLSITSDVSGRFFAKPRRSPHSGAIGQIHRLEGYCSNIFDWGTHWIDMMFFYNNEEPASWVMAQIDSRTENELFGVAMENRAICRIQFMNGVTGLLETGADSRTCALRIMGSDGLVEVGVPDGPELRSLAKGDKGWQEPEIRDLRGQHSSFFFTSAIIDLVEALKVGREPELSARKALQTTEVIFSAYESSRRRARIDLPLDIEDSPFLDMLERRLVGPRRVKGS